MALTYDQLTSITQTWIIPKAVDNIFSSNLLLLKLRDRGISYRGGYKIRQPIIYQKVSQVTSYSGYDLLPTNMDEVDTAAELDWKQYACPISISGKDLLRSTGKEAILELLDIKRQIAELTLLDKLGTGIFSDGTTSTDIDGLRIILSTTSTYGGIAVADFSNWVAQIDSSTNTLTLSAMQTIYGNCCIGNDQPDLIITLQSVFNKIWSLYQEDTRLHVIVDEGLAKQGFLNLLFNRAIVGVDSHCPGSGAGSTDNYICFLNLKYLFLVTHQDVNFKVDPFQKPVNQDAMVSHIRWAGNLVCSNRRMQGAMTAINPSL